MCTGLWIGPCDWARHIGTLWLKHLVQHNDMTNTVHESQRVLYEGSAGRQHSFEQGLCRCVHASADVLRPLSPAFTCPRQGWHLPPSRYIGSD